MKKLFLLTTLPLNLFAQGLFISPHISLNKTALYNKEDTKDNNKILYMVPTIVTNYGLDLGWSFEREHPGLSAITLGFNHVPIKQKYKGVYAQEPNNSKAEATTHLQYVQANVKLEFGLMPTKRIQPILKIGAGFNFLLSYEDKYHADWGAVFNGKQATTDLQIVDNTYHIDQEKTFYYEDATLDQWYYKKTILIVTADVGAKISLGNKFEGVLLLNSMYGLKDAENKSDITYSVTSGMYTGIKKKFNPYENYYAKQASRSHSAPNSVRGASHINSIGLQIGFNYKLFNNKQSKNY
jgi:hypothetical protein